MALKSAYSYTKKKKSALAALDVLVLPQLLVVPRLGLGAIALGYGKIISSTIFPT